MAQITQEMMNKTIKECLWRRDTFGEGYEFCSGMCLPCKRVIETGKCDALIHLFKEHEKENTNEID